MHINKKLNQHNINKIINNKHVIKYNLDVLKKYRDKRNLWKGQEEFYISGCIELNITNKNDLDRFMEEFLKSPLRSLNVKIIHNIKSRYYSENFEYGVAEKVNNGVISYVTLYSV